MPAHNLGARVYVMRRVLEEACERLLRRLREDDLPTEESSTEESPMKKDRPLECGGVQRCTDQLLESVRVVSLAVPPDPQELARRLSETCGWDLLPPAVLQALAQRLIRDHQCSRGRQSTNFLQELTQWMANSNLQGVARVMQRVVLREERLAAFLADETPLSFSLFREMRGLLGGRHWDRLRVRCAYMAEFTEAEEEPRGAAEPEVQVRGDPRVQPSTGGETEVHVSETYTPAGRVSGPDPEVNGSNRTKTNADADPEVDASAATRGQRVDLAIGDRITKLGFYMELKKNPKDRKALQGGRDKLRAILSAERVSAPGSFNTTEENRVCYQVIFYTPDELAQGAQGPGEMEKLLRKQSSWVHVINCYDETWRLPKREVVACILEVKPDF